MADILLVEDKDNLRRMLRLTLESGGYSVEEAIDGADARRKLEIGRHSLVLTDLKMPRIDGFGVLQNAVASDPEMPVIVMTAFGSIDDAVQAMKQGAYDFIQKPIDSRHLLLLIERALEQQKLRQESILLREEYAKRYGFPRIIGDSEEMARVGKEIQQVAQTNTSVLLLGESGTGKELFARAIHHLSPRKSGPFIALNCAAIPETLIENELFGHEKGAYTGADARRVGKFELANHGTVFLDEIGELALAVQSKILRVLEERVITRVGGTTDFNIDVRVIAATNRNLQEAVTAKAFRDDLYFRLAVFPVNIPPLRERKGDITELAEFFAKKYGRELRKASITISPEAMQALVKYPWPGNVRELENCLERACILCDGRTIKPIDLSLMSNHSNGNGNGNGNGNHKQEAILLEGFDMTGSLQEVAGRASRIVEKRKIETTLKECGYNKTRAADVLAVSYKTLLTRIKELGLE
jgi:DNA-binding NtrC family response regulator